MTAFASTATVVEHLVDFDGPQLLLLKTNRNRHMMANAVRRQGMQSPFFGCEVTDRVLERYFSERADLHFVFSMSIGRIYYTFDLAQAGRDKVQLLKLDASESQTDQYWPEVGFFSRSHTTTFNRAAILTTVRSFKIDGKWAATDFSVFHTKMSDLYALFGVLERLKGAHSATERGFVHEAVQQRFWQGGGSYGGFYDSLIERNRALKLAPLEVARIQYASPGEISLSGNGQTLASIADILDLFDKKHDELNGFYGNIYGALKKEGLLSAPPEASFSTVRVRKLIERNTRDFGESMQLDNIDQIYDACEQNALVFAKVILSVYRRANELYKFHAEGRVQSLG
jgi:hypothetical protein